MNNKKQQQKQTMESQQPDSNDHEPPIRVLEFYSGIGGMHYALSKSGINFEVVGAFDINTNANAVYKHNFPCAKLMQKNLEGLTVRDLNKLSAHCWTMSPPCQPYTRQGKQEASKDARAKSFLHILDLLVEMQNPPSYIFLENVKGFDVSDTRTHLLHVLETKGFNYKEFLLSPVELGIPNSRLRYYMLAKRSQEPFPTPAEGFTVKETKNRIRDYLCEPKSDEANINGTPDSEGSVNSHIRTSNENQSNKTTTANITEHSTSMKSNTSMTTDKDTGQTGIRTSPFIVPDNILLRFSTIMDIVSGDSQGSCCFTKAYGKYIEGTGSIFSPLDKTAVDIVFKEIESLASTPQKPTIDTSRTVESSSAASTLTRSTVTTTTPTATVTDAATTTTTTATQTTITDAVTAVPTTTGNMNCTDDTLSRKLSLLRSLRLRYFSPSEISRLLCFPEEFKFPEEMTIRQKYQLLGNSVNVFTIAHLMSNFLFANS